MDLLQSVIVSVGTNAAVIGAIAFLARSALQIWLQADLESFKAKLRAESERSQFPFQKLYEMKLNVIAELHQLSVKAGEAASYTVRMQGNVEAENIPVLAAKVTEFSEQLRTA